jgi:hypothetical protein
MCVYAYVKNLERVHTVCVKQMDLCAALMTEFPTFLLQAKNTAIITTASSYHWRVSHYSRIYLPDGLLVLGISLVLVMAGSRFVS